MLYPLLKQKQSDNSKCILFSILFKSGNKPARVTHIHKSAKFDIFFYTVIMLQQSIATSN